MTDAESEDKPKAKRGPRMCESCGERRAAGGDKKVLKEMTKLCTFCSRDHLAEGKCPMCRTGLLTDKHKETCLTPDEAAA
jgi:hypothetical protein